METMGRCCCCLSALDAIIQVKAFFCTYTPVARSPRPISSGPPVFSSSSLKVSGVSVEGWV